MNHNFGLWLELWFKLFTLRDPADPVIESCSCDRGRSDVDEILVIRCFSVMWSPGGRAVPRFLEYEKKLVDLEVYIELVEYGLSLRMQAGYVRICTDIFR